MRYIANVSFGKDSLAMLLRLIDESKPLDEVIFYNTGMEFQSIYNIRDKVIPLLEEKKITFTELKPPYDFEYMAFEKVINAGKPNEHKGMSWCGGMCRWGTHDKIAVLDKHCKGCIQYVGIAADEERRLVRVQENKIYPLAEWGMTEADCLQYCYTKGFSWDEDGIDLYSVLKRVSCWCCKNKNLKELRNIYYYLPKYWDKLKEFQSKTSRPMKGQGKSVFDLEERFSIEYQQENFDSFL